MNSGGPVVPDDPQSDFDEFIAERGELDPDEPLGEDFAEWRRERGRGGLLPNVLELPGCTLRMVQEGRARLLLRQLDDHPADEESGP